MTLQPPPRSLTMTPSPGRSGSSWSTITTIPSSTSPGSSHCADITSTQPPIWPRHFRSHRHAELDVIVSDIELPDGSGLELVGSLRQTGRPIPAIALSGFGSSADVELSHSAGFAIHLTKPVDFRQLEEAIRQVAASIGVGTLVTG